MSESLAIGIVCYPSLGGSSVIATELAAGLAQRGHRVHVIASAPPSRPLPLHDGLSFHLVAVSDYPLFDYPQYALAVASAIVRVSQEQHLDVVHAHYAVPHAASAYLARQVLGPAAPRFVTTLHGTDVTGIGADPSYQAIIRLTVAAADHITAPSEFLRGAAYRELGLPADTAIEVIPNFVDTEHFAPPERRDRAHLQQLFAPANSLLKKSEEPFDKHVLSEVEGLRASGRTPLKSRWGSAHAEPVEAWGGVFQQAVNDAPEAPILFHVSNLRPVKRPTDLMEVLARVRRHLPARLVVVGDGPQYQETLQRARDLGVEPSVCFLGKRAEFADYLKHADVFLLPSSSESFGVAALEAMSAGVPVCGYRVGGLPEVVTEATGRLVEPFDVDALARAVIEVVSQPERRAALGHAARARALEHFRREPALQRYEACYQHGLGSSPRVEAR